MILSQGRKYVFVHIPKTGGTALTLALEQRAMKGDILIGDTPKARSRRARIKANPQTAHLRKHSPLADLGPLLQPDFFCFTLVRNPWNRLVSYYHWLRAQEFDHPVVTLAKTLQFGQFLHHPVVMAVENRWPAAAYMLDAAGKDCAHAYLRLEHLFEDIPILETHLGFSLLPLPQINASQRAPDWRGYYSDADAAHVAALCAGDIAQFGYRFDP